MPENVQSNATFVQRLILGGILFVTGGFSVLGAEKLINDFNATGTPIESTYVAEGDINVFLNGSGGLATYFAGAVENPLSKRDSRAGSGVILELAVECGAHPKATGTFDVVLASSPSASSGKVLPGLDNICGGSGSTAFMTSAPQGWGSGQYIVVKSLTNPTASFTGRLRGKYRDVFGE